jgi:hypothetical protein
VALDRRRPTKITDLLAADAIAARISKSDFLVADTRSLTAPGAKVALVVLEDGQVVIGYGDGKAVFLDPELSIRGTFDSGGRLGLIVDVSEVPGLGQVIVSGTYRSVVLDALTRVPLAAAWRGGPFTSTSVTADGRVLATSNFVRSQIVLWPLSRPDLRRRVCKAVGRDLTQEEWARFVGPDPAYRPVCGT